MGTPSGPAVPILRALDQIYILCVQCVTMRETWPKVLLDKTTFFNGKKAFFDLGIQDIGSNVKPQHNPKVDMAHVLMWRHAIQQGYNRIITMEEDVSINPEWWSEKGWYERVMEERRQEVKPKPTMGQKVRSALWNEKPEEKKEKDYEKEEIFNNTIDFVQNGDWNAINLGGRLLDIVWLGIYTATGNPTVGLGEGLDFNDT